jgi:uncharacterized membrane protein
MSYKRYTLFRVMFVFVIAALGGWAASSGHFLLLIPAAAALSVVLFILRRRVTEVVVDERINTIAYRASRLAFVAFVILAVIAGAALTGLARDASETMFQVGLTLDYAACALMVFYGAAYFYYNRKFGG